MRRVLFVIALSSARYSIDASTAGESSAPTAWSTPPRSVLIVLGNPSFRASLLLLDGYLVAGIDDFGDSQSISGIPCWNQLILKFIHRFNTRRPNVSRIWNPSKRMMILKYRSITLLIDNGFTFLLVSKVATYSKS